MGYDAQNDQATKGQVWMTKTPCGYTFHPRTDTCPGTLIINEAATEIVRQIFRWVVEEQRSPYQIVQRLNGFRRKV